MNLFLYFIGGMVIGSCVSFLIYALLEMIND